MKPKVTIGRPDSSDPRDIAMFVDSRLSDLETRLCDHFDAKIEDVLARLMAGFPGGDLAAHKADHVAQRQRDEDGRDLRRSLLKNGVWGAIATVAAMNWEGIKSVFRGLK